MGFGQTLDQAVQTRNLDGAGSTVLVTTPGVLVSQIMRTRDGGVLARMDDGRTFYSPDGRNLDGAGSTVLVTTPGVLVSKIIQTQDGGVLALMQDGRAFYSLNGKNLDGAGTTTGVSLDWVVSTLGSIIGDASSILVDLGACFGTEVTSSADAWFFGPAPSDNSDEYPSYHLANGQITAGQKVSGLIVRKWAELGGPSRLGSPQGPGISGDGYWCQEFGDGVIDWSVESGIGIREKPAIASLQDPDLGKPLSSVLVDTDPQHNSFTYQKFEKGFAYYSNSKWVVIYTKDKEGNSILNLRGDSPVSLDSITEGLGLGLGFPTSDRFSSGNATYRNFQHGVLFTSGNESHSIIGNWDDPTTFLGQFSQMGGTAGLGLPTTDPFQTSPYSRNPRGESAWKDHAGVWQTFQKGDILFAPATITFSWVEDRNYAIKHAKMPGDSVAMGVAEGTLWSLSSNNTVSGWNGTNWVEQPRKLTVGSDVWFLGTAVDSAGKYASYEFTNYGGKNGNALSMITRATGISITNSDPDGLVAVSKNITASAGENRGTI